MINKAWAQMEREQQEEMQVRAWAITVTQGGGTPGPSTAVVGWTPRVCKRCMVQLGVPEGCLVSEKGKACIWPLGLAEATAVTGSRTEGSGKPVPRHMVKRRTVTMTNTLPQGGEKHKKVHMMTEEGEDDEDTEEVFRVPRVMAVEQRDMLGMLTQALVQVAERLAAMEAHCRAGWLAVHTTVLCLQFNSLTLSPSIPYHYP